MEEIQKKWAEDTLRLVERKLAAVSERSAAKIPYTTVDGAHDDRSGDIGWWTNGFWGGMMWQMYHLTGEERYRQIAEDNERKLDACLMDYGKLDHDNGFKWLPTAVADYRVTGNPASKNRALLAAGNLAGRYNNLGNFIRAWNDWGTEDHRGWAIIDCMMNLPLLYWASEETGDPRFRQSAVSHADTSIKAFIRGDGSVNHIVEFDLETGEPVKSYGGQGCGVGSSWTRGQAWGLYGFTLSFLHTGKREYLDTAGRIADYFLANIPESGLIPVDFRQPKEVAYQDSTAAAIAACGLIELSKVSKDVCGKKEDNPGGRVEMPKKRGNNRGNLYLETACRLLRVLAEQNVNWNEAEDNLLEKCTAAYHDSAHEFSIIYGDYYFLEALLKLTGRELFIW